MASIKVAIRKRKSAQGLNPIIIRIRKTSKQVSFQRLKRKLYKERAT
ncbi:MAG: hypothetical protein ACJATI_004005 [Halioglobus sp.]|jgi:hypothetical protein